MCVCVCVCVCVRARVLVCPAEQEAMWVFTFFILFFFVLAGQEAMRVLAGGRLQVAQVQHALATQLVSFASIVGLF